MLLGIMSVNSLTPYITIYYLYGGNLPAATVLMAANGTVWTVTGLLMVPVVAWAAGRFGKKQTLIVCLALALFGNLLKWNIYSPEHPWTIVIPQFFVALAFASLWTLLNSMIADACDYTELQTGERLEGILAGLYGWLMKLGGSLAFLFSGLLIDLAGFNEASGASQADGVITTMRLIEMGLPAVAYICALALLVFYPLTEARMTEIQGEIRKKKNKPAMA
jgi:GPH family glycoside/pentoside/hexuronide:cation symporter